MSAPDVTADMLDRIRSSGLDRHLTLLLGAGASASSGLPDWDTLAVRLVMRSSGVSEAAARRLIAKQDPLLIAEAAKKSTKGNWTQRLRSALYENTGTLSPSALHVAAAGHFLAGGGSDTTLLTLNFDTLIEDALRDDTDIPVIARTDDAENDGEYGVHHLHGIANPVEYRDVVLTLSDFNDLLSDPESWQLRLLKRAVGRGALVIAGTSYRDPDLRRWLHVAFAEQPPEHAALVLLAREAFGLAPAEFAEVKTVLEAQWESAGLTPILVEDYADAAQILRELRHIHAEGYLAPQQRARLIWDAHAAQFNALQTAYADRLAEDAATLRAVLDVDSLNLTLWLADGSSHLARWAAQDRVYRAADDLRLVDTGHGSDWVSGQALAAEDLRFRDLDDGTTRRWRSVLAVPIRVEYPGFPEFATAVLSIGLPALADAFASSQALWLPTILTVANDWSSRLVAPLSPTSSPTLT